MHTHSILLHRFDVHDYNQSLWTVRIQTSFNSFQIHDQNLVKVAWSTRSKLVYTIGYGKGGEKVRVAWHTLLKLCHNFLMYTAERASHYSDSHFWNLVTVAWKLWLLSLGSMLSTKHSSSANGENLLKAVAHQNWKFRGSIWYTRLRSDQTRRKKTSRIYCDTQDSDLFGFIWHTRF